MMAAAVWPPSPRAWPPCAVHHAPIIRASSGSASSSKCSTNRELIDWAVVRKVVMSWWPRCSSAFGLPSFAGGARDTERNNSHRRAKINGLSPFPPSCARPRPCSSRPSRASWQVGEQRRHRRQVRSGFPSRKTGVSTLRGQRVVPINALLFALAVGIVVHHAPLRPAQGGPRCRSARLQGR